MSSPSPLLCLGGLLVAGCASLQSVRVTCGDASRLEPGQQACVYDAVVREVAQHCALPDFDPVGWNEAALQRRPEALSVKDEQAFYGQLQQLVAPLREGHMWVKPPGPLLWERAFVPAPEVRLIGPGALVLSAGEAGDVGAGDELLAVDGRPIAQLLAEHRSSASGAAPGAIELDLLWRALGGKKDSQTRWTLRSAGGAERVVALTRARLFLQTASELVVRRLGEHVLYVAIPSFAGQLTRLGESFQAALRANASARALIVDVRSNGGGSNVVSDALASALLEPGTPLTTWKFRSGQVLTRSARTDVHFEGPVVVLTSGRTCSAADSFTAVLRANRRALVVGEPTCGSAGVPHRVLLLPGGWSLPIATGYSEEPNALSKPVTPDVLVTPTLETARASSWAVPGDPAQDAVLAAALEALERR